MDVLFTYNDLEAKYFNKENSLFNNDSEKDKITILIDSKKIILNKSFLIFNFNFFNEKISNFSDSIIIFNHIEREILSNEDVEFFKNKFFSFLSFLFLKEKNPNFRININEIIKFIEICIIFEPKNIIIEKIHKIIFLNSVVNSILNHNSNINRYYRDKINFLMQKLENSKKNNFENFVKIENSKSFFTNNNKNIHNINGNISNTQDFEFKKNKFTNFNFSYMNKNFKNDNIFFRYSFSLIRYLYDLPVALSLKGDCFDNSFLETKNKINFNEINLKQKKTTYKDKYLKGNPYFWEEQYEFKNKKLEEETLKFFQRKNQGFYIFVDNIFDSTKKKKFFNSQHENFLFNKNYLEENYFFNISKSSSESSLNKNKNNQNKNLVKNIKNKILIKKNLENILFKEFTEKNKQYSRYFLMKNLQNFELRCEKAVLIQTNFRRYFAYKNYLLKIKDYLKFRFFLNITKIQTNYRAFLKRKQIKNIILIENILYIRFSSAKKIKKTFGKFRKVKNFLSKFLQEKILQSRLISAIKIQSVFRGYKVRKFLKEFFARELNLFKITYPFKAQKVQLKLFIPRPINEKHGSFEIFSDEKLFNFQYCDFRKIFVLYLTPKLIKPGKYRALLLVDGSSTCDGRYPHVEFSDGFYYNVIDIKDNNLNSNRKISSIKEELVDTRNSYDNVSYYSKANSKKTNASKLSNEKNSMNSAFSDEEEDHYISDDNYNFRELKRNLWGDEENTRTVCYMQALRDSIKDEL